MSIIIDIFESNEKPLLLDGAMGSLLDKDFDQESGDLWSARFNISDPWMVREIHGAYISAGADIITTNTFRTNPAAVKKSGQDLDSPTLVRTAVDLAKDSVADMSILIAGSNAPAEDCYQRERILSVSDLEYNHKIHIDSLWESGCDFILNETQSHLDEILIIAEFCESNKIPNIMSLYFDKDLKLLSGESLIEILKIVIDTAPLAVGLNCIQPDLLFKFLESSELNYGWGFYLNCGIKGAAHGRISCGISPANYISIIRKIKDENLKFIGSCCGSGPEHTLSIRKYLDEEY